MTAINFRRKIKLIPTDRPSVNGHDESDEPGKEKDIDIAGATELATEEIGVHILSQKVARLSYHQSEVTTLAIHCFKP